MNWIDNGSSIEIYPPMDFNFKECLVFLGRSEQEVLHQIKDGYFYKLIKIDGELVLLEIVETKDSIRVEFPISSPTPGVREKAASYVWEYFDMNLELGSFYEMADKDKVLQKIVQKYRGFRIICIPDLFEALIWAIIGQQINLTFAYTLKKRFVEHFGECLTFEGNTYWLFPEFETIANIEIDDLRKLQFTFRKAEYITGVAKAMTSGQLTKEALLQQDYQQV